MAGGQPKQQSGARARSLGRTEDRELRRRLIDAVAKVAAEQGYERLSIEQVSRYAGVSPATFAEHFESKEQGLIAAFELFLERLRLEMVAACDGPDAWPLKVRAAVRALLASLVETSALARVFAVEAAAASLAITERQLAALDDFASLLRDGRSIYPRATGLPGATERVLVGGIASLVSNYLLAEDARGLTELERQLVELVLAPYVGEIEARRLAAA